MPMPAEMQAKKKRLEKGGFFMTVLKTVRDFVGAGVPAKQATRWMAPALPVFAGMPAPTVTACAFKF
ncbi:hypothetical protein [Pseudomonas asiatica]|uniref:hypothetical protein n=1 Tax=Pseudomonas asiatica TaxID=2219225 RepID=UPI001CC51348|nr:hypothetical protein [Pseudomonas asiatica]